MTRDDGAFAITAGTGADREWAAGLMAASEPWITLGRGIDACRAACARPECVLYVARDSVGQAAPPADAVGQAAAPADTADRGGFALVNPRGVAGAPYLVSIAVAPEWRSRGIGAALLAHCEREAALTSRHFFLCVSSFNSRAQSFYRRQGYTQVGEFPDYIIEGASELLFYKRVR